MSTRGQVYFDRNFLHFQSADIRGLTARPHATPGLFRGQPRSKSRTPERHMRFAVRRRGQVKPYLTDRGQPRSTAVTSRSSEIHGFCLQESMNVVRSLPLVSPASQHAIYYGGSIPTPAQLSLPIFSHGEMPRKCAEHFPSFDAVLLEPAASGKEKFPWISHVGSPLPSPDIDREVSDVVANPTQ